MSKLLLLSWRDVVKALTKAGFQVAKQKGQVAKQKGSHAILVRDEYVVPVPKHREIKEAYCWKL